MENYFHEIGMGIVVYTYLIFPFLALILGILAFHLFKNIWLGPIIAGLLSFVFYIWYSIDIGEDYKTIFSMLHLIFINIFISLIGSSLIMLFKNNPNKKQKLV
ncbi:uncharacterized protein involved in response to NO [Peribacillus simplex]|uniref:hypothetical protein n=1 Tax=Peribacillus simplex TaxID=1478 RepID=UPI0024E268D1|nr:hypothetical protein [Peribacillus simplex]MDF9759507.1 uncharacterized protein involved in response to NO [Peribacillus simplex]